jgi:hypothetical protein
MMPGMKRITAIPRGAGSIRSASVRSPIVNNSASAAFSHDGSDEGEKLEVREYVDLELGSKIASVHALHEAPVTTATLSVAATCPIHHTGTQQICLDGDAGSWAS